MQNHVHINMIQHESATSQSVASKMAVSNILLHDFEPWNDLFENSVTYWWDCVHACQNIIRCLQNQCLNQLQYENITDAVFLNMLIVTPCRYCIYNF